MVKFCHYNTRLRGRGRLWHTILPLSSESLKKSCKVQFPFIILYLNSNTCGFIIWVKKSYIFHVMLWMINFQFKIKTSDLEIFSWSKLFYDKHLVHDNYEPLRWNQTLIKQRISCIILTVSCFKSNGKSWISEICICSEFFCKIAKS